MPRDSVGETFKVAGVLCIVCSVLVAGFAVALRPLQEANRKLDQQRNVLVAAGINVEELSTEEILAAFAEGGSIQTELIDLETGETAPGDAVDPGVYSQREAAGSADLSTPIEPSNALGGIQRREKYAFIYKVKNSETGRIDRVVLPVYGKGLWSTLYGYLAVGTDASTVKGITFYEHKETPGLGGEVDNASWKAGWVGKQLLDGGEVALHLVKGKAASEYEIDGLSGATITCNGVTEMLEYWFGENGYQRYLERFKNEHGEGGDG